MKQEEIRDYSIQRKYKKLKYEYSKIKTLNDQLQNRLHLLEQAGRSYNDNYISKICKEKIEKFSKYLSK